MIIIVQKEFTGGNGRGTYDYQLENGYEFEDHGGDHSQEDYDNSGETGKKIVPDYIKDRLKDQKVDTISNNVHETWHLPDTPRKIKDPIKTEVKENSSDDSNSQPEVDIQPEEKKDMSLGAKAGLATAGIAAVGAAGYGAYRAIKRRKAKRAEINAEVDKFLKNYKKD